MKICIIQDDTTYMIENLDNDTIMVSYKGPDHKHKKVLYPNEKTVILHNVDALGFIDSILSKKYKSILENIIETWMLEQSIKDVKSDLANGNYVIETAEEHCKRIADNVPDASKMVNNRLADIRKTIGELLESN